MRTDGIYMDLLKASDGTDLPPEDRHVLASLVALAMEEVRGGNTLPSALGLHADALESLLRFAFPQAPSGFFPSQAPEQFERTTEEDSIRQLLLRFRTPSSTLAPSLATLIARRSMHPNHLWQDLGLRNRTELSRLMSTHFAPLAHRNHQDMKWKRFFYRMTCTEEGFALCAAPVCSACSDLANCFGDESGESLLARNQFLMPRSPEALRPSL